MTNSASREKGRIRLDVLTGAWRPWRARNQQKKQQNCSLKPGEEVIGLDLNRCIVGGDRIFLVSQASEAIAPPVPSQGGVWLEFNNIVEDSDRLSIFAEF